MSSATSDGRPATALELLGVGTLVNIFLGDLLQRCLTRDCWVYSTSCDWDNLDTMTHLHTMRLLPYEVVDVG